MSCVDLTVFPQTLLYYGYREKCIADPKMSTKIYVSHGLKPIKILQKNYCSKENWR